MPYYSAFAPALAVRLLDTFQGGLNDEKLLITGNLFDSAVKNSKFEGQLQQALRSA
ncbi:MAG: hypothetical protein A4E53_00539 [Pelotomaculum sp. PtaB.Bin104]|nr:MAG: hypothetical protein A4E53_00539 [Pelotomaculum sp. PtaB.Bin104]